ncbi:MAG: membrane protein insertion efficiency factor YidD [Candidatus Stahlbacteria bacterium]|nr:membrane protein insertion efficiency factor YidD [Candidatus Stahlbacteria bacterium]
MILVWVLKIYQKFLSPFLPIGCRFYPSCSSYMMEAIKKYGSLKGLGLGTLRILRCNPWTRGGYDPVPCNNIKNQKVVSCKD